MSGNPNPPPPVRRPDGGLDGGPPGDECNLRFRTQLASPQPGVVALLSEGDVLTIGIRESAGVRVVAAVTTGDEIAGSIVDYIDRLLACIQAGNDYIGTVTGLRGGAVTIEVRRS